MSLIKWTDSPFEAMERMFLNTIDDLDIRMSKKLGLSNGTYVPNLDIFDDNESFYIIGELPGLDENDVKVTVDNDVLTISGRKERKEDKKVDDRSSKRNYHRIERSFGEFVRSLSLPKNIEANAIKATFKNGLLEITMPKVTAKTPAAREIPLNTAKQVTQNGSNGALNGSLKTEAMRVPA